MKILSCPFGVQTDIDGCPKTSQCLCKSPCEQVHCLLNEICIMRPKKCQDETCLPVPVCETNPCHADNSQPAVDARSLNHLICSENRTDSCPHGFYCTSYDSDRLGLCCPGRGIFLKL